MRDEITIGVAGTRTDSSATVFLARSWSDLTCHLSGIVRGPFSKYSKTLTADFILNTSPPYYVHEALVTDPCYWTPQLPFWYDVRVSLQMSDQSDGEEVRFLGMKRFYCEGRSFILEGKRVVLRGRQSNTVTEDDLVLAREYETALWISSSDSATYTEASIAGVPLVVDLRSLPALKTSIYDTNRCFPAIMIWLVSEEQVTSPNLIVNRPGDFALTVCVGPNDDQPTVDCHAYAIELQPGERPPAWSATCDKPVIAIRKDPESEIRTARAGCDKLQAELAPEFDLAGYFV